MNGVVHEVKKLKQFRERHLMRSFAMVAKLKAHDCFFKAISNKIYIGLGSPGSIFNLDEIRCPTLKEGLFVNYYEQWSIDKYASLACLDRSYLHLYAAINESTEVKLISIHCDPDLKIAGERFDFVSAPHVHFSCSPFNLHRAHIPLCLERSKGIYDNGAEFWRGHSRFVSMIANEFLANFIMK